MSIGRQIAFWVGALVVIGLFLHLLGGAVTPFALGIALGYLLDPIVQRLERLGLNRLGASIVILVAFVVTAALIVILVAPILGGQLVGFTQRLPSYVVRLQALAVDQGNGLLDRYGGPWRAWLGLGNPLSAEQIQKSVGDLVAQGAQWLLNAVRSLAYGGAAIFSFVSILIVTPVVAFYMLVDWEKMLASIDGWAAARPSRRHQADRRRDQSRAGRLSARAGAGLPGARPLVRNRPHADRAGLRVPDRGGRGMLSFIPYLGGIVALVVALGVAVVQGWPNWSLFFLALLVVSVGQFLEGYVLAPRLVGKSIGLHPVWLMFALVAFGDLFGFVGLLIAVPMAAAIGVLARHLLAVYLVSPVYRGRRGAEPQIEAGGKP